MATSTSPRSTVAIRTGPRPVDLRRLLSMHGEIYAREHGFDERFEAHVARGLAGFATALGEARDDPRAPEPGWLWVAERDGDVVGTVALTDEGAGVGQLRWFLVAADARGCGLGRALLQTLLEHARDRGFTRVQLWTVHVLETAARLYLDLGFQCTERRPTHSFGIDLDELRYDLELR